MEWNYGKYEGLTPKQINKIAPGWLIFRDGCPGGDAPEHVGNRVDRAIARVRAAEGDCAVFAHGHVLRVLGARWTARACGTALCPKYGRRQPARLLPQYTLHKDLELTCGGELVAC